MYKYRARQLEIEAIQLTWPNWNAFCDWVDFANNPNFDAGPREDGSMLTVKIKTLEGDMVARETDYIVKGTHGEYYPVKKEIIEYKYERMD